MLPTLFGWILAILPSGWNSKIMSQFAFVKCLCLQSTLPSVGNHKVDQLWSNLSVAIAKINSMHLVQQRLPGLGHPSMSVAVFVRSCRRKCPPRLTVIRRPLPHHFLCAYSHTSHFRKRSPQVFEHFAHVYEIAPDNSKVKEEVVLGHKTNASKTAKMCFFLMVKGFFFLLGLY